MVTENSRGEDKQIKRRAATRRRKIDESLKGMATDQEYRKEASQIMEEFAASDAEALRIGEQEMPEE